MLVAPSHLDELPAVTQRLLERVFERRAELDVHAPLFYGIAHFDFAEPVQRRAELRSMRFFAEQMGWLWQGGVGLAARRPTTAGLSTQAGVFSRRPRTCLPFVVAASRQAGHSRTRRSPAQTSLRALCRCG